MGSLHGHNPGLLSHSPAGRTRGPTPEPQGLDCCYCLLKILGTGKLAKQEERAVPRARGSPLSWKQLWNVSLEQCFLKLPKHKDHPRGFAKMYLPGPTQNGLIRNWALVAGGAGVLPRGVHPPLWALLENAQTHHVFDQQVSRGEGD